MSARTEGRVAFVTGAGQGVGRATAIALSAAGIEVAAIGRTQAKLDETVALLPGREVAITADLTDPDQVRGAFKATHEALGGVDILINCAAEYSPFRINEGTDHQITNMIAQSLTSALFCMRDAVGLMRERGGGDIVNITTQSAEMPQPFMSVYGAARAAVETLSQGLRCELKDEDFRVIVLQLGIVANTSMKPGFLEERERMWDLWRRTGIGPMYAYPGAPAERSRGTYIHEIKLRSSDMVPWPGSAN